MKWLLVAVTVLVLSTLVAGPVLADTMTCDASMGDMTTIQSLIDCVNHAISSGYVSDPAVAQALLATLNAANAAQLHGNTWTAINNLNAFISQVQAQSGVHIDPDHATHMIMHAQMVIADLGG